MHCFHLAVVAVQRHNDGIGIIASLNYRDIRIMDNAVYHRLQRVARFRKTNHSHLISLRVQFRVQEYQIVEKIQVVKPTPNVLWSNSKKTDGKSKCPRAAW